MLEYRDSATFVIVNSTGYGNNKIIEEEETVSCIFLQNTAFSHSNFRDNIESDAICYPDPTNDFILENYYRLEGMYIKINMFGSTNDISWYKIENVSVNRNHLLGEEVDNIELNLKKTRPIPTVS